MLNPLRFGYGIYVLRFLVALAVYDLQIRTIGFAGIHRRLSALKVRSLAGNEKREAAVGRALSTSIALYPGKVMCLQRSVVSATVLRKSGIGACLVVGYRSVPFFSHAWVEVNSRVLYDQDSYRTQLMPLLRSEPPNL